MKIIRQGIILGGQVQGVGFRPFLYRLARHYRLTGWACNRGGQVWLEIQGEPAPLAAFTLALQNEHPPLAAPQIQATNTLPLQDEQDFIIRPSEDDGHSEYHLPTDQAPCAACQAELFDPLNRRYRYPFINCTDCGPRYTLIDRLPYDRARTSMAAFPLCEKCAAEYRNPLDRRFHAEPIACPDCGPQLRFVGKPGITLGKEAALTAAVQTLRQGQIVAVKGVGGYHLLCNAGDPAAIARLRRRKQRPHKPLAVLFPWQGEDGLDALRPLFHLEPQQEAALNSPQRPIVLCRPRQPGFEGIAPGLDEIGVMLPYSPLHRLLSEDFGGPLVATSANLGGEPVICEAAEAERVLGEIADAFLHHDRAILQRADDPIYRPIAGRLRPLRLGRGDSPLELTLPHPIVTPTLALGAQMKNTVALAWGKRCVVSPHIGDLDSPQSLQHLDETITTLQKQYGVRAAQLVLDAHPGYNSRQWARESGLPQHLVWHHHAHASALYGEYPEAHPRNWLVFAWDGVGLGPDGQLWGGEGLTGRPGQWQHFSQMRSFRLPGGDLAAREAWRCAASLCWESGLDATDDAPWQHPDLPLLKQAWQRGINAPWTSAVGRLFDAAAALLGLCQHSSYEGQAAMLLEAQAARAHDAPAVTLPCRPEQGIHRWDWQPLLALLQDTGLSIEQRALAFHQSLAETLLQQALQAREQQGIEVIGMSGGVFQNRLLVELASDRLMRHDFTIRLPYRLPGNDAGLAWGQICDINHSSGRVNHPTASI